MGTGIWPSGVINVVYLYLMGGLNVERIIEAVTEYWGVRCSDADGKCNACQAWQELDQLAQSYSDLRDLAARYDALLMHLNTVLAEVQSIRKSAEGL
jgi:hypothetical protein